MKQYNSGTRKLSGLKIGYPLLLSLIVGPIFMFVAAAEAQSEGASPTPSNTATAPSASPTASPSGSPCKSSGEVVNDSYVCKRRRPGGCCEHIKTLPDDGKVKKDILKELQDWCEDKDIDIGEGEECPLGRGRKGTCQWYIDVDFGASSPTLCRFSTTCEVTCQRTDRSSSSSAGDLAMSEGAPSSEMVAVATPSSEPTAITTPTAVSTPSSEMIAAGGTESSPGDIS